MQRHANMSLHEYSISMPVNMNVVAIVVIIIQAHKRKNKKKFRWILLSVWLKQSCSNVTNWDCVTFQKGWTGLTFTWPFNSHKWLAWNFSLKYPYILRQTVYENIQTYQVEAAILI